jgi:SAM-dependent methyltransferase
VQSFQRFGCLSLRYCGRFDETTTSKAPNALQADGDGCSLVLGHSETGHKAGYRFVYPLVRGSTRYYYVLPFGSHGYSLMHKSISYDQEEIFQSIRQLYVQEPFQLDPTYSKGTFYRSSQERPELCFDISPQSPEVRQSDCRDLPIDDGTIRSIMFDPPFLATRGPSLKSNDGNIINRRFSVFPDEPSLHDFYRESLQEFYRVLKPGGWLVFKCQDKVSSGKQYFSHCFIYAEARTIGFYAKDLFVYGKRARIVANWQRNQQHARKHHCYFWVLQKKKVNLCI